MRFIALFIILFITGSTMTIFKFQQSSNVSNWRIVDDGVMGGRSDGHFEIDKKGHGRFYGEVSLENNGGFSSLRYGMRTTDCESYNAFSLRIKGDGKKYQFRSRSDRYDRHSYNYSFQTSGEWETINIPFDQMKPGFRGMKLRMPNYPGIELAEIAFLIGNKKAERFELLIDKIELIRATAP